MTNTLLLDRISAGVGYNFADTPGQFEASAF